MENMNDMDNMDNMKKHGQGFAVFFLSIPGMGQCGGYANVIPGK